MNKYIRILQMNIDNVNRGGAYILIHNIGNALLNQGYIFDYLSMDHFEESEELGDSKFFSGNLRKNRLFGHIKLPFFVRKVLSSNHYSIIHINTDSAWKALLYAIPAKKSWNKNIIVHIHATGIDGKFKILKKLLHWALKKKVQKISTIRVACSREAANWFFGEDNDCIIVRNGIVLDRYKFNEEYRNEIRNQLSIGNEVLLGNVGVISETKNQIFLLDILARVLSSGIRAKLILVGNCSEEWKDKIVTKAQKLHITKNVILYGASDEIPKMNCAVDIMLIPSVFEGFSLSALEAQASGAYCIISDRIPEEAIVSKNVKVLSLEDRIDDWVNTVQCFTSKLCIEDRKSIIIDRSYDISNTALQFKTIYSKIIN